MITHNNNIEIRRGDLVFNDLSDDFVVDGVVEGGIGEDWKDVTTFLIGLQWNAIKYRHY